MSLFSRGFDSDLTSKFTVPNSQEISTPITLDEQQTQVVYSEAKNIIVVAGAGSGKTRVLTERIRHLIEDCNVPSHNIVSITFTNMAAEEMKLRLSNVVGIGDAFIGTIHSFANHIMKESGERYTLLNDDLDNQLHKELIGRYCQHLTVDRYLDYKDMVALVEVGKQPDSALNGFLTPSEQADLSTLHASVEAVEDDLINDTRITFGESIKTLCKKRNIITFDELIEKAREYFKKINASIEYVFVDEFQDVGGLEYSFIKSLNAENYFFVGDDYQSIYGFKGGNVNIFKGLVADEKFATYYLTNNYRSGSAILNLADYVISQVDDRVEKEVIPMSSEQGSYETLSKNQLIPLLSMLKEKEENFKDWFLLVRTNKELFEVANVCIDLDIPYTTFKREGLSLSDVSKKLRSEKLKILTVHTSKGLEVDNVILYGNFPLVVPYYRKNDDERKVMYVGITRAKKTLRILN
jgi:superfamily I DNA/RNA helicase